MIRAHGGELIDRIIKNPKKEKIIKRVSSYPFLVLDNEQLKDVKNIGRGVYSPLKGFLRQEDFFSVLNNMRLASGVVWPIPIVLDIDEREYQEIKGKDCVVLKNQKGEIIALLKDPEVFEYNKKEFAQKVFQTTDKNHPGVEDVFKMKKYLMGGEIFLLDGKRDFSPDHNLSPKETREIFKRRNWKTIVGFQTRNVPHRGHEFLQKEALKEVDGLFIQPVIGRKKIGDFKDEYILTAYEILLDRYYLRKRVVLSVLPLKMRYAGPREAVFHAIIRKNYGCTHFIVGRDHAGVGNYYGPFDAQNIFDRFKEEEIGIKILKFPEVVYCSSIKQHTFIHHCPKEDAISFSGTKLRESIKQKIKPPEYIIRAEVYGFLANSHNALVDNMYNNNSNNKNKKSFVLWFTGLSQSGKTTIADRVYKILTQKGLAVERLDGDIMRQYISRDLGFTKEDRNENIRRVAFVSKLLSRNGVSVVASFISPYKKIRQMVRNEIEAPSQHQPESHPPKFIEVFCKCSLEVCEKRDAKGLYEKARKGEIQNFTGISDPYEEPENPEITLFTDKESIEDCLKKILKFLEENKFI